MSRLSIAILFALSVATPAAADPDPVGAIRIVSDAQPGLFGRGVATLDFDGDGIAEIVVGDAAERVADVPTRGNVRIYVRTPNGYQPFFSTDLNDPKAEFGRTLATGDFDEDGRDDVLIGAPGLNTGGGGVYLFRHLDATTLVRTALIQNGGASGGRCGAALVTGDFNDDGHLDYVAGCPNASFNGNTNVGRVQFGLGNGNGTFGSSGFYSQESANVGGGAENGDEFGAALAAGDFNCDGIDDVAIGVPGESVDGGTATGALHVLFGSLTGLSGDGSQLWHQGVVDVPGTSGNGDRFGAALAAANFDQLLTACDDLAIGIPNDVENPGGSVLVLDGSIGTGLVATNAQVLVGTDFAPPQGAFPQWRIPGSSDRMGVSLLTANVGGTARRDLIIGVEGHDVVLFPSQPGLACVAFTAGTDGVLGGSRRCYSGSDFPGAANDKTFGTAIAAGDVDDEPGNNLIIGAPGSNQAFILQSRLFVNGFEGDDD